MSLAEHPYASFVQRVQKPARYVGGEYLSIRKDPAAVDLTLCLAFPDVYDIGMSHLGTKILYDAVNRHERLACERVFAPWPDMEAELRARGVPLVSLESARPLSEFDVLGFSLQYELTFTNVLNILDLAGLPLRAADRGEDAPLVIAGGPVGTHPEPIAPFLDAVLIGEAEEHLPRTLHEIARWRREGRPRRAILEGLAALGGWYCPALYETREDPRTGLLVVDPERSAGPTPVRRVLVADLDEHPFPTAPPVAAAEAIFDRTSVEIARGCTEGCRFCQAGMIYRPVRERDPNAVVDTVVESIHTGGYDKVSLTALSTADYSAVNPLIKRLMARLREEGATLSVSSLRAYGLDEELLDEIATVKNTGLTFAPEAGTQRLRDVINKNIRDEDLMRTAERVFSRGWSRMKLYFMIGLPTETDEDIDGIIDTAARARSVGLNYHRPKRLDVTASVSSFVPKPHTPFQWAAMASMETLAAKQERLRQRARARRVTLRHHDTRVSYIEGIVARGDRRVADAIEGAFRRGCRFDGWDEQLRWDAWQEAIAEAGLDPARYLSTLPLDGGLPWDHVDVGLADGFLAKEWKRANRGRLSPPCGKPLGAQVHHTNLADARADARKLVCYHCGIACDLSAMRAHREEALEHLGALAPTPPEERRVPVERRRNRRGHALPPVREHQGPSFTYRVRYTKLDVVSLTSQRDLLRALPRLLRRAGIRLKRSSGFSPKPLLSYGPALPLGVASLGEIFDFTALESLDPAALVPRLNAVAEPGIRVLDAALLPANTKAAARAGRLSTYLVAAPGRWDAATLQRAAARVQEDTPLVVEVSRSKGARVIDVRDGLVSIEATRPTAAEAEALHLAPDTPCLRWTVDLHAGAHVRPGELACAATGTPLDAEGIFTARVALEGFAKGQRFDPLRPPASPVKAQRAHTDADATAAAG